MINANSVYPDQTPRMTKSPLFVLRLIVSLSTRGADQPVQLQLFSTFRHKTFANSAAWRMDVFSPR